MSFSEELREAGPSPDVYAHQDDCLVSIEDGKPVRLKSLNGLPPWRAVLIARVAERAGVPLEKGTVGQLIEEARKVGGEGKLGTWWEKE